MFEAGDQVAYVPRHANGIGHPDVEFGFVTSQSADGDYFVRYWRSDLSELRTKANSELTPSELLRSHISVPTEQVLFALAEIE